MIPASYQIREAMKLPGTKILMKAGRQATAVREILKEEEARGARIMGVENCGMPGERFFRGAEELREDAGYYTLIFVKEGEEQ